MDALDGIMSDFECKVDDNGAGVCFGGRGARAATEAQHCLHAGEAAETGRPISLWLAPLALPLGLDARDRIYLSLIVVLLAVVLAQWCAMLWGGW